MKWSTLNFGKHQGKTLPQVMFNDPDWFFHGWANGYFKGRLREEAEEIYRKSCVIRVPRDGEENVFIEYFVDRGTGRFVTLHVITGDMESYRPMTRNMILKVIDMTVPRQIMKYDKRGYKNFLSAMKAILFGEPGHKMTKGRCEDFFSNDENFALPEQEGAVKSEKPEVKLAADITTEEAWACVARWAESL